MGEYEHGLSRGRSSQSAQAISQAKNGRCRARSVERLRAKTIYGANGLSPEAQLKALDFRLGKGEGAKKERLKLIMRAA